MRLNHRPRRVAQLETVERRWLLSTIAFFDSPNYVDASISNGTPAAASNLRAELEGLGDLVVPFTGTDAASVSAALAGADLLLVPDLPNATPVFNNTTQGINATNENSYLVERATGSSDSFAYIGMVGAGVTQYVSLGLTANTAYRYRIRASGTSGRSDYGNVATATTAALPFAVVSGKKVAVNGTAKNNTIEVVLDGSKLRFTMDGRTTSFAKSSVTSISIFAGDGNDRVTIGSGVRGCLIEGGAGNDHLNGGDFADTIFGQNGKDTLSGNGGADHLDGGKQNDRIYADGDRGVDTLAGGEGKDWAKRDRTDVVSSIETIA